MTASHSSGVASSTRTPSTSNAMRSSTSSVRLVAMSRMVTHRPPSRTFPRDRVPRRHRTIATAWDGPAAFSLPPCPGPSEARALLHSPNARPRSRPSSPQRGWRRPRICHSTWVWVSTAPTGAGPARRSTPSVLARWLRWDARGLPRQRPCESFIGLFNPPAASTVGSCRRFPGGGRPAGGSSARFHGLPA
jgi:hypothetical protein